MYDLIKKLFPINRSLTGNGVRESLDIINDSLIGYDFTIHEINSGESVYDWTIPKEWNIKDAYILTPDGNKIADFKTNNLHVVGYSTPIDKVISKDELDQHIYYLENQPNAIPYVTSYYRENWGFCLTSDEYEKLPDGDYRVYIDSELKPGSLTYADLIIPGYSDKEIMFSTYICHPSMANNELSGPALMTALINYVTNIDRYYSYRFVMVPETIGSITYISKNLSSLQKNVIAGYNLTCVGDDNNISYVPTRYGNTLSDKIALHVLDNLSSTYIRYSFLDRGSDERQYCSPGVDLPIASVMRSKYGEYEEYHTSLDNLNYISPEGLQGSFDIYVKIIHILENNKCPKINVLCEPQLGKRGLYPTTSIKGGADQVRNMMNVLAYSDGFNSILDISNITNLSFQTVSTIIKKIQDVDQHLISLEPC